MIRMIRMINASPLAYKYVATPIGFNFFGTSPPAFFSVAGPGNIPDLKKSC